MKVAHSSTSPQAFGRFGLWVLIALPPLFLLAMMQYSAVTMPFWDHCELVKFFVKYYDGTLRLRDLWSPHNHTRPFTYRAVMMLNGILTRWDVRSEYIYLLGSLYAAFLLLAHTLWRLTGREFNKVSLVMLAGISILHFSPGGNNNHWWSMMCQLTFTHFFILLALTQIAFSPLKLSTNLLAVVACWLATFTLTNGLFAVLAVAAVVQFAHEKPWKIHPYTIFWAVNFVILNAIYWPGLPESTANLPSAGLLKISYFALIYIGSPILYLINFPFHSFSEIHKCQWNAVVGLVELGLCAWIVRRYRKDLLSKSPEALLFVGFVLFCILSALGTGRARAAFDAVGVRNGGASRYTIFGSYLTYGLVFFLAGHWYRTSKLAVTNHFPLWARRSGMALLALGLVLSTRSYVRSLPVYKGIHDLNRLLAEAYSSPKRTASDDFIYPNPDQVLHFKAELRRLRIGPYRLLPLTPGRRNSSGSLLGMLEQ